MPELTTSRRVMLALAGVGGVLGAVQIRDRWKLRNHRRALRSERTADDMFDPSLIESLPEAAQRYFRHAIAPDTPLARRVELTMEGQLRLGERWLAFDAEETLAAQRGFVWQPNVQFGPGLKFSGADFHVDGTGGQRFALAGLVPIVLTGQPSTIRRPVGFSPSQFGSPRAFFRQWGPSGRGSTTDGRA